MIRELVQRMRGAAALNCGGSLGRLRRGFGADMMVLEVPQNMSPRQLRSQILEGAGECLATIVQGQIAWQRADPDAGGWDRSAHVRMDP